MHGEHIQTFKIFSQTNKTRFIQTKPICYTKTVESNFINSYLTLNRNSIVSCSNNFYKFVNRFFNYSCIYVRFVTQLLHYSIIYYQIPNIYNLYHAYTKLEQKNESNFYKTNKNTFNW